MVVLSCAPIAARVQPDTAAPHREILPGPARWETMETRTFTSRGPSAWKLILEKTTAGYAVAGSTRRPLELSRIRIRSVGPSRDLAVLQHVNNTQVELLPMSDARVRSIGPALQDSLRPWPNTCMLGFYDVPGPLDLNRNDRLEQPVRRFASIPEPGGTGLLFLEADASGKPRLMQTSEYVDSVRFEQGNILALSWPPGARRPNLEAEDLSLYRCRFLSQLEIRGESECENCCSFPILLRPDSLGVYHPFYDRQSQRSYLNRMESGFSLVAEGKPNEPLRPVEQAALARSAAFLYLTGSGVRARLTLESALGPRAELLSVKLFLGRLQRFFLYD